MPPFKPKKEPPFKKRKVESTQVGPLKSSFKLGLPTTTVPKSRLSVSPLPSPPEQSGPSSSPFGTGNLTHGHTSGEDAIAPQVVAKEDIASSEKEMPIRAAHGAAQEASAHKVGLGATPMDLQSHLIMLLMENPKGMSLKALEKAIGDTIPNSTKKIEPIIKKIATFQAPGRYILKKGVELDSLKKPLSESGSSPECIRGQTPVPEKATTEGFEKPGQLSSQLVEESNEVEKTNIQQSSPDIFGDKKLSDNSEGQAGSSSDSGSDSDSESESSDSGSDSGSQSRSVSKSRSPAGSGSGSSSDSESDGSSSSKEGSDVDVDIMTSDDDKEAEHKLQPPELKISDSPIHWKTDAVPEKNEIDEDRQHAPDTDGVDKDLGIDDHENEMVDITDLEPKKGEARSSETIPFSPDHDKKQEVQYMSHPGKIANEMQNIVKDVTGHEQSDNFERVSKSKSKREFDVKHFEVKPESAKRSKAGMPSQPSAGRRRDAMFSDIPHRLSPDRLNQDSHEDHAIQMNDRVGKDGNADPGSQKGHGVAVPGRSISDAHQSGQRSLDISARGKTTDRTDRSNKYLENLGRGSKLSEKNSFVPDESNGSAFRSMHTHEKGSMPRDKIHREKHDDDGCAYEKLINKNVRESVNGDRSSLPSNIQYRNHVEQVGKSKDASHMMHQDMGPLPMHNNRSDVEKSPALNGRGALLRRELSDLELGELREPMPGAETQAVKKQFERKTSFKLSENKPSASDSWDSDFSKGRTVTKASQDSRKQQSPFKKRASEDDAEDSMRPQQKAAHSLSQQLPGVDRADNEVGPQSNKFMDMGGKSRKNEAYTNKDVGPEGCGSTHKKAPTSAPQQHEPKHTGQAVAANMIKESKSLKSNSVADVTDRRNGSLWMESNSSNCKRRESSSDEDSCSYSKYDKDEPEFKGPIKDFSQYKEYVQEYCEKYGSYCSLNKILETHRNDFNKLGRDLEVAKSRDLEGYYNIMEQLKEMYRQHGTRHKRLKKIFIVLHEELKHLKQRIKDFALPYTKE
ncbi:dentin sialophosphoprotein isoform X2 [Macadamia integrifolia]|nr:dentin sialophosphoprotein isoform X2 [Macadamia integrifolia]